MAWMNLPSLECLGNRPQEGATPREHPLFPSVARPNHCIQQHSVCSSTEFPGYRSLHPLGVVHGITVRSCNLGDGIGASLRSLLGGEIKNWTRLCEDTRDQAVDRMLQQAAERGASGVLGVRYDTNKILPGITEVTAYGMAVSDGTSLSLEEVEEVCSPSGASAKMDCKRVSTANHLPGYTIRQSLGVVQGITVRSCNMISNIGGGLKSIVGGEIGVWTDMCKRAREEAQTRMIEQAVERGADGVIGLCFSSNELADNITEVVAYGTAVSSTLECSGGASASESEGHVSVSFVTTSTELPGGDMKCPYGVVQGLTVRSCNVIANVRAGLNSLVGGEVRTWTVLCEEARDQAFQRMLEQAKQRGAKGVVSMRYDTTELFPGITEIVAYGTAVSDEAYVFGNACAENIPTHLTCTSKNLDGWNDQYSHGMVEGFTVRSCNIMRGIGAGMKAVVGGEIRNWTSLCELARGEALQRMLDQAAQRGAAGVVAIRFGSNAVAPGVIEIVAYGTAVSTQPSKGSGPRDSSINPIQANVTTSTDTPHPLYQHSLGIVRGITVRSCHIGVNIGAGLKTLVGGEIESWTNVCEQTRREAFARMLHNAADIGAKAIVAMQYETNDLADGVTEVFAYGTALTDQSGETDLYTVALQACWSPDTGGSSPKDIGGNAGLCRADSGTPSAYV